MGIEIPEETIKAYLEATEKARRESPYFWVWELQRLNRELPMKIADRFVRVIDRILRFAGVI